MNLSIRRWRPGHLLAAWAVYWLCLALVALGPGLGAAWRATRPDQHGTITAGFAEGVATASVTIGETTLWSASAGLGAVMLWIAGPPVLLWLAWLAARPRRAEAGVPR